MTELHILTLCQSYYYSKLYTEATHLSSISELLTMPDLPTLALCQSQQSQPYARAAYLSSLPKPDRQQNYSIYFYTRATHFSSMSVLLSLLYANATDPCSKPKLVTLALTQNQGATRSYSSQVYATTVHSSSKPMPHTISELPMCALCNSYSFQLCAKVQLYSRAIHFSSISELILALCQNYSF